MSAFIETSEERIVVDQIPDPVVHFFEADVFTVEGMAEEVLSGVGLIAQSRRSSVAPTVPRASQIATRTRSAWSCRGPDMGIGILPIHDSGRRPFLGKPHHWSGFGTGRSRSSTPSTMLTITGMN